MTGPRAAGPHVVVRTADWRFLLDDPQLRSVVAVGGADERLTDALALLGTALVSEDAIGDAGAAVAFVRDPDDACLGRAIALRAPSGAIVVETTTRRARRTVGRRLRRAGLRVRTYGAWPTCSTATRLVPLGDRAEMAASARAAKNRRRRAIGMSLTQLGLGSAIFAESTTVAMAGDRSMVPAPLRVAFGDHVGTTGTMTLLTPRFASSRHVIAMLSDRSGGHLVAKTPRVPGDDDQVRLEVAGLTSIAVGGPPRPAVVTDAERFGQRWLVQTRVAGEPLSRRHVVRNPDRWSNAANRWLREMPTAPGSTPDDDGRYEGLVRPAMSVLEAAAVGEPALAPLLEDAESAIRLLRSVALPVVCEHGDFRPPNLIVTGPDELAAVDWELAEPNGFPLHDLRFFHSYVVHVVPEHRPMLRRSGIDALRELDIEPTLFRPLATLAAVRQLANEVTRLAGGVGAPSRMLAQTPIARAWFDELQASPVIDGSEATPR